VGRRNEKTAREAAVVRRAQKTQLTRFRVQAAEIIATVADLQNLETKKPPNMAGSVAAGRRKAAYGIQATDCGNNFNHWSGAKTKRPA
jgi:hypothetical protein